MACELTVSDVFGRSVTLTHETWERHIVGQHAEMARYHDLLPPFLTNPHLVIEDKSSGRYSFWRRGILRTVWVRVVVEYRDEQGIVLTAYLTGTIQTRNGAQRWPRRKRS
jgi:hypothetical protein